MASSAKTIRDYTGPAIFERGYRPFFFGAALMAGVGVPLWMAMWAHGFELPSHLDGVDWHVHEMLFGYLSAAMAGFILTAVPNWTGRLPVAGAPLAALFGVWVAGRVAMSYLGFSPVLAAIIDVLFLVSLASIISREVLAGGNTRNLPVCVLITTLAVANIGFHFGDSVGLESDLFVRLGFGAIAVLLVLIGGRVTPSFTRNWMAKNKITNQPAPLDDIDKAAMLVSVTAVVAWVFLPDGLITAFAFAVAAVLLAVRLYRWHGWLTVREPIVAILHVGYAWLVVWAALMALSGVEPGVLTRASALHALSAGAAGTMTIAIMTRATLGHSGHEIRADWATTLVYALIICGGVLRVVAGFGIFDGPLAMTVAGGLWSAGFLLFAIRYAPILFSRT